MLPIAILLPLYFVLERQAQLARRWVAVLAPALLIVLVSKLAFLRWHIGIPSVQFRGVSGHSFFACSLLPVVIYLLLRNALKSRGRLLCWIAGTAIGVLIGISRVVLNCHFPSEVIAGCTLGAIASAAFLAESTIAKARFQYQRGLHVALLIVLVTQYGHLAPTDEWLDDIASTRLHSSR
jgi:hypothetical protein